MRCDELSQPGPSATFCTRSLTDEERKGMYGDLPNAQDEDGGGKNAPKAARKFKQAILLDNGVTMHKQGAAESSAEGGVGPSVI